MAKRRKKQKADTRAWPTGTLSLQMGDFRSVAIQLSVVSLGAVRTAVAMHLRGAAAAFSCLEYLYERCCNVASSGSLVGSTCCDLGSPDSSAVI